MRREPRSHASAVCDAPQGAIETQRPRVPLAVESVARHRETETAFVEALLRLSPPRAGDGLALRSGRCPRISLSKRSRNSPTRSCQAVEPVRQPPSPAFEQARRRAPGLLGAIESTRSPCRRGLAPEETAARGPPRRSLTSRRARGVASRSGRRSAICSSVASGATRICSTQRRSPLADADLMLPGGRRCTPSPGAPTTSPSMAVGRRSRSSA